MKGTTNDFCTEFVWTVEWVIRSKWFWDLGFDNRAVAANTYLYSLYTSTYHLYLPYIENIDVRFKSSQLQGVELINHHYCTLEYFQFVYFGWGWSDIPIHTHTYIFKITRSQCLLFALRNALKLNSISSTLTYSNVLITFHLLFLCLVFKWFLAESSIWSIVSKNHCLRILNRI